MANANLEITRDIDGVAVNNVENFDIQLMTNLQDEMIQMITEHEIIPVLSIIDIMVSRGYWVEAVKDVLCKTFAGTGMLKHYVHGDNQDCNVAVSYDTIMAKSHIGQMMDRLEAEYNEVVAERVRNIRF